MCQKSITSDERKGHRALILHLRCNFLSIILIFPCKGTENLAISRHFENSGKKGKIVRGLVMVAYILSMKEYTRKLTTLCI